MTTAINYVHTRVRTTEHCYDVEVNGVLVAAANNYHAGELVAIEVERRNDVAQLNQAISALEAVETAISAELAHTYTCVTCGGEGDCPDCEPRCPCGQVALFFVQYPDRVYGYCPVCYSNQKQPPLLAQCAAIIRRCLGRTTGAESIIEELRRVEQELSREGY